MKKIFLIAVLLLVGKSTIHSQVKGFHLGGRFGMGESSISTNGIQNTQTKLAISGGVATNYQFNEFIGLNADFLITSAGVKSNGATKAQNVLGSEVYYPYKEKYDLINAELPLTGQLSLAFGDFFIRAYSGPAINFRMLALQNRQYDDANYNDKHGYIGKEMDQTNNLFYSMVYGLGIGAMDKNQRIFFLDLRLSRGLTPLGTINNYSAFSNYYCLSGGYTF